ncbi:MAG: C25 family cysteine peptidase [Nocardioides sp.]|jgi:hypothetical protein
MPRLSVSSQRSSFLALLTTSVLVVSLAASVPAATGVAAPTRAPAPSATEKASPAANKALRTLVTQTGKLSRKAVRPPSRTRLVKLSRAARSHANAAPCRSVAELARYRTVLKGTKVRPRPKALRTRTLNRLAGLNTLSTRASLLLLASPKTRQCGGGVAPSTRGEAKTTVMASTGNHLKVAVAMPKVIMMPERVGGRSYVRLLAPDTVTPGRPGQPGIPIVSELFGVPEGAQVSVDLASSKSVTLDNVQLFPTQPEPVDDEPAPDFTEPPFSAPPFVPELPLKGTFPQRPADADLLGTARDVRIGRAGLATAQYTPSTDTLKVFTNLVFDVKFKDGKGFDAPLSSPWELSASRLVGGLLNEELIRAGGVFELYRCGEELMVITSSATFAEAQTYANARVADGFRTRIYTLGRALGTTATAIQTFIRSHVNSATCIRPSYVTIIGDDEYVPTFTTGPGGIPSDNPYSTANNADELPDIAVGRILGNTPTELQRFIAKINHYTTTPPTGSMLTRASIAAQFQDTDDAGEVNDGREDRTFIQFAETARTGLVRRVVTVDRIYEDGPTTTPTHFNDGTALPSGLLKPGFAWDGDGADVSAAWNAGRFLMVHRDHGWSDGWGDPLFTTTEVNALTNTNDQLPVLMSINCASASYDNDETSFVQQALVKETGGAVAAFGDTRNSPSWHNSQIGLGFLDGLLPHVLLGEGPSAKLRVGDALVNGKLRLAGLAPPSGPGIAGGDGNTRNELYLWHLFGDPTMKMYGGTKQFLILEPRQFTTVYRPLPPTPEQTFPYEVEITLPQPFAGQPISLMTLNANGGFLDVVGKAVGDGSVKVTIPAQFSDGAPDRLAVVVNADDANPVVIEVPMAL